MLPSKAERILSRYRPIAPKPLPLPPSGSFGTDASSTCASVDSFTSSAKCKKSRKRKADDATSTAKALKAPKPIGSGLSNTGGASSLTQGASDGTVPRRDPRLASQVSYASIPFGMEDCTEMSNGVAKEVRGMALDTRFAAYSALASPVYVGNAEKMVPTQGLYMSAEARAQQQHHYSVMHQQLSPGCNPNCVPVMDKDAGFMERAAAASVSVMPEKSASLAVCDVGCVKGLGYSGGGFTEMIRGITRLPTAADVQSLMQARASPSAAIGQGPSIAVGTPGVLRSSPTSSREMPHQRLDPPSLPNTAVHSWMPGSSSSAEVDQVCGIDAELVTLPLLPDIPSRMCPLLTSATSLSIGSPSAQAPAPSHKMEPSWHHQVSPRVLEPPLAAFASRSVSLSQTCPLLSEGTKKVVSGLMAPSMSSPVLHLTSMADGAAVDESYLEQVYGGSTDPVLLVDENNEALWYNKAYDKAMRSASDRLTGKAVPAGPYIDPLGHPTPLGSFVFPVYGMSVRATLWGFLKKLVIQESDLAVEHGAPPLSSQLRLSMEDAAQRMSPIRVKPVSLVSPVICSGSSRVTNITLESITELHMDAPVTSECVEAAEVRLGVGSEPAFITDCLNRVRWANVALTRMLGNFDGSSSHVVPCSKGLISSMPGLAEALGFVICCTEKVPHSAWAFSCRLNLEWMKGGRRRSMTVPCDVTRLASRTRVSEVSWVWQFDMAVSLCLNASS
ncbi:hypothetical protein GOP47_0005788 [Adiantum capillus-veneris]|uniref:DUF7950 domain-containing protein n=1 Tax=Adiantum capillus-veneris TaxID=13818 RepID=A0A9D4V5T2_ADICA|nr:hypothetical protein GOP47_0005788 [Adiantum capillus-veneris]